MAQSSGELDIDIKVTGLADLRSQLKAAKDDVIALQSVDVIDPEKLAAATKRAGALKDALNDANEQIKVMSGGSDFEKVSSGLGLIGSQLKDLDFEGANNSAKNLTKVIQTMNPTTVAKGFSDLSGTVLQLGKAFVTMGLQLLANPIFLIVAVIVAVVAAIVMLKDKLFIVQKAFDLLMAPINAIIQALKNLTDQLGLTTYAEDEAAEATEKSVDRRIKANERLTNSLSGYYDRQINELKALGKDTTDIEIKKSDDLRKIAESNAQDQLKIREKLQYKINDYNKGDRTESARVAKEKYDKAGEEYNKYKDQVLTYESNIRATKNAADKKVNDDAKKTRTDRDNERKKDLQAQKEYEKQRLDISRLIIDLQLAAENDGVEKTVKINNEKYRRLIEDTINNEKLLPAEKKKLKELYEAQNKADNDKTIADAIKQLDDTKKLQLDKLKEFEEERLKKVSDYRKSYNDFIFDNTATSLEKELKQIDDKYKEQKDNEQKRYLAEISNIKLTDAERLKLKVEHISRMRKLDEMEADDKKQLQSKIFSDEDMVLIDRYSKLAQQAMQAANAVNSLLDQNDQQRLSDIGKQHDAEISLLDQKQQKELSATNLSEAQKDAINKKYAKQKYELDLKTWKQKEEIKKKQFARDKAFRIANAVMDTGSGIVNALGNTPGPPWVGIAMAALVGAMGLAQIATIASQKYEGEAGPSAPGGIGGVGGSSSPTEPSLALYGKKSEGNTAKMAQTVDASQQINVTAVVSETEITTTQGKVAKMQKSAEL